MRAAWSRPSAPRPWSKNLPESAIRAVLCNAGPLIALGKLNRLDLLASLYGQVQITAGVYDEVVTQGRARGMSDALTVWLFWQRQDWPIIKVPVDMLAAYAPPVVLDAGETEILALAQTLPDAAVLMDDETARSEARRLGLHVRGTLGIIAQAHEHGLVTFPQVELLVREIAVRPDIWISGRLCDEMLDTLRRSNAG